MKKILKRLNQILSNTGFKISSVQHENRLWLEKKGIKTVIDIGASKGNSIVDFKKLFPEAMIYAFEPLRDCFQRMEQKTVGYNRVKLFNLALGDTPGEQTINRSSYSGSSSLRIMMDLHKNTYPVTAGLKKETITVDTLDNVLGSKSLEENILIKIDVQGFEDKVINGGRDIIKKASVIIIETSFVELYKDQPLFGDIHSMLSGLGFNYVGAWAPDMKSPLDGASLQQDSVFVKPI